MNWPSPFRWRRLEQAADAEVAARPGLRATVLTRRGALGRLAGLAVVGAVAEKVVSDLTATPASAATTVDTGAMAPAVVMLTDASTISVDASAGSDFRVMLAGNRTLGNPANPVDGQQIIFQVTQGPGGGYALSYGTAYAFSAGLPRPTLSTTAGHTDLLGFIYSAATGSWLLAAYVNGFN